MIKRPTQLVPPNLLSGASPLKVLYHCLGYYDCPKQDDGLRLGPLCGYAGTYDDGQGGKKQYVGEVYYNFSQVEQLSHVLHWFALKILAELNESGFTDFDAVLGAPMGGIALAEALAFNSARHFVFAEKKETVTGTEGRAKSVQVLNRHVVLPGMSVLLVEDVCNNFSTTEQIKSLIESRGAELVGVVCAFNRSSHLSWKKHPIFSPAFIPTKQYRQDDPTVAHDIAVGRVEWKPKDVWLEKFRPLIAMYNRSSPPACLTYE